MKHIFILLITLGSFALKAQTQETDTVYRKMRIDSIVTIGRLSYQLDSVIKAGEIALSRAFWRKDQRTLLDSIRKNDSIMLESHLIILRNFSMRYPCVDSFKTARDMVKEYYRLLKEITGLKKQSEIQTEIEQSDIHEGKQNITEARRLQNEMFLFLTGASYKESGLSHTIFALRCDEMDNSLKAYDSIIINLDKCLLLP